MRQRQEERPENALIIVGVFGQQSFGVPQANYDPAAKMAQQKRSFDEFEKDRLMGVGESLSLLQAPAATDSNNTDNAPSATIADSTEAAGEWQVAESKTAKKRRKLESKHADGFPSISHSSNARLQSYVKISDLQNLCLYLLADGTAPQWCSIKHHLNVKKIVVLMVPGLESGMFDGKIPLLATEQDQDNTEQPPGEGKASAVQDGHSEDGESTPKRRKLHISPDDYYPVKMVRSRLPGPLSPLGDIFPHLWPVKSPGDDRFAKMHSPIAAFLVSPSIKATEDKKGKGKGPHFPSEGRTWQYDRTPITEFIASTEELISEGYVLHPAHYAGLPSQEAETDRRTATKTAAADGWVDTKDIPTLSAGVVADSEIQKGSITMGRQVLSMDCEMCITSPLGASPRVFSLTRVSLIDWHGDVVLDELVKPADPITDYVTAYSGITADMLAEVTTTLADVQCRLLDILTPHSILVGHSLNSDLNALKLTHPFVIDTALLYPHPRGPPLKSSLRWLSQRYLGREIQKGHGSHGHSSIEDARACLDLVRQKCERGKTWGTPEAGGESIFKRIARACRPKRGKNLPDTEKEARQTAIVDWGDPTRGYGTHAQIAMGCANDTDVVSGIVHALSHAGSDDGNSDGGKPNVPSGGCDFVWARLRELEAFRGWWSHSKTSDGETLRTTAVTTAATQNANTNADETHGEKDESGNSTDEPESAKVAAAEPAALADVLTRTVQRICAVHDALPPCTALIVYSGSGDPRELTHMQTMHQKFKQEYRVKKWDELSVRWTDVEEQQLRQAAQQARKGLALITVK